MRKLTKSIFILIILLSFSIPSHAETVTVSNDDISLQLTINDAFYTDYEGDGLENDVIADYELNVTLYKDLHNEYKYTFHVLMVLPSGAYYEYAFDRTLQATDLILDTVISFNFRLVMWDHATESGWYNLTSGIEIYQWGHEYDDMTITFDPPEDGGTGDTLPPPSLEE